MNQILNKWLPATLDQSTCGATGPSALSLLSVISAFALLVLGFVAALFVAFSEAIIELCKGKKVKRRIRAQRRPQKNWM